VVSDRNTRIQKAKHLLEPGIPNPGGVWAELGCGDGIFTAALCDLTGGEGQVYAVDKDRRALMALERNLAAAQTPAQLDTVQADFTQPLVLPPLDGAVMANSLHFIRHKEEVLAGITDLLRPGGRLIVVEYNTADGTPWVPYPLDEHSFLELAARVGLQTPDVLARIPTSYLGQFYAGIGFAA
jgi:ubiquinone/menaquinone biosynthesis C-methylase UbiE